MLRHRNDVALVELLQCLFQRPKEGYDHTLLSHQEDEIIVNIKQKLISLRKSLKILIF